MTTKSTGNVETPVLKADHAAELLKPLPRKRRHRRSAPRWLRKVRRQLRRVHWRAILLIVLAAIAVAAVAGTALVADTASRVQASTNSLNRVLSSLRRTPGTELRLDDYERLRASVNDLAATLNRAETQTAFLRPVAHLNADLNATLSALSISRELVRAGQDMLLGLEPTLFFLMDSDSGIASPGQISAGERAVELLSIGRGRFASAADRLQRVGAVIEATDLSAVSPALLLELQTLAHTHELLVQINELLLAGPELLTTALGLQEQQTYLIMALNSDELRPSGGYVSTYGWMTVRSGRIVGYNYSATTATSPNPPSASAEMPFTVPEWWIQYREPRYAAWDGSWYADFPSTANMAMWYYNTGNNPGAPVIGVLAIDLTGFQYILEALGEVHVPGYNRTVSAQNYRNVIYDIRATGEGDTPHKQFLIALYQELFRQWQNVTDQETSNRILGAVVQGLQEQHIMLHFADERLSNALDLLNWSGSQKPAIGHDYLMVVDANLGNKSNSSIIRQITYDVEINDDGSLNSRATVAYDYPAALAEKDPAVDPEHHGPLDYSNLLQVFVPDGSELTATTGINTRVRAVNLPAHEAWVSAFTLDYDSVARIQYSYTTPPVVETIGPYKRYRLLIEKQPGTQGDSTSVQVLLPPDARIVGVSPEPVARYELDRPIVEFRAPLVTDQWIEITYEQPDA